jgi:hypothetical protein
MAAGAECIAGSKGACLLLLLLMPGPEAAAAAPAAAAKPLGCCAGAARGELAQGASVACASCCWPAGAGAADLLLLLLLCWAQRLTELLCLLAVAPAMGERGGLLAPTAAPFVTAAVGEALGEAEDLECPGAAGERGVLLALPELC